MRSRNPRVDDDGLPRAGFMRLWQIIGDIGDPDATPPIPPTPAIIPVSRASWWLGVKKGIYPEPVKLSANTTAWRVSDIRALIARLGGES